MRKCYICDKRKARDSEEKTPVCNVCADQYDIEFDIVLVGDPDLTPPRPREEVITEEMELPMFELDMG